MVQAESDPSTAEPWVPQLTQDGSFTFFSAVFNETFHSTQGAKREALEKFAIATQLPLLAQQSSVGSPLQSPLQSPVRLLDVCYGLGYNTAAALETLWRVNPHCPVELYGLELDASVPIAAANSDLLQGWSAPVQASLRALAQSQGVAEARLRAQLLIGDARQTIAQVQASGFQADAVFFDPFSPRRCPQLWTVDFFRQVAAVMTPQAILATYSRSASVRSALVAAGLKIGTIPLSQPQAARPHEWSLGTVASFSGEGLMPLSPLEQEHLQTRAGIPLRDPGLNGSAEAILAQQQQEQAESDRESTSSWRRRWGID